MMEYKDRVQIQDPRSKKWVKLDTKTGRIMTSKNTPWKNVNFRDTNKE